jgi:Bardet-Biedl syndrome 5 protein
MSSNDIIDDIIRVWQDREIRFDSPAEELGLRRGEFEVDRAENIEDTRAYPDEPGRLIVTNLRVMWISVKKPHHNVSVGFNTVSNVTIHTMGGQQRGLTQALFLIAKCDEERLEFTFTNMEKNNSPRVFISVQGLLGRYETSRLYRDVFTKGVARIKDKQLIPLKQEELSSKIVGVWLKYNGKQSTKGTVILTNIRCIWFSDSADTNNISIPYIQMVSGIHTNTTVVLTLFVPANDKVKEGTRRLRCTD